MKKFFLYKSIVAIWCAFISIMAKFFYANSICPIDILECAQHFIYKHSVDIDYVEKILVFMANINIFIILVICNSRLNLKTNILDGLITVQRLH